VALVLVPLVLTVFHHHIHLGLVSIVLLSIINAAFCGLATVLQHQAAIREPARLSMHVGADPDGSSAPPSTVSASVAQGPSPRRELAFTIHLGAAFG